jgi:hypothetical protein
MSAQQDAQIGERPDAVQPGAGEQRHEEGVHEGPVVAADEEPVAAPEDLALQVELAEVVVDRVGIGDEVAPPRLSRTGMALA